LKDPNEEVSAFNSAFERHDLDILVGVKIPASRFQDPQASARYLSLPASLEDVGTVLGLPHELRKDKQGKALIEFFSLPKVRTKKQGGGTYFNDHTTHPAEFAQFGEYCKQDVRAEREIARRLRLLGVYPLPPRERAVWIFDQGVNDRGIPVDRKFVQNLFKMADRDKKDKKAEQDKATGLANSNSVDQLLPWVRQRGYPLNNLRKENIQIVLKDSEVNLTKECRDVLEARMIASSTSYKKLQAILRNISPDDRLRNQFIFMGSSRCGRWSGNSVQLHNMARPDGTFEDMENVLKARNFVYADDYYGMKSAFKDEKKNIFYSPLIISKNLIRTVFVAPTGKRFNVADLKSIETVVGAWVAGCQSLLNVFISGKDSYIDFGVKMTGIPYEKIAADIKSKDPKIKAIAKRIRQVAKPGVLGAIYRMSAGKWETDYKTGDRYKSGLWGYAEGMGIDMTQEEAIEVVKIFRESYPEICGNGYKGQMKGIWILLEEAVADVLKGERITRRLGPEGCIRIDKRTIQDRDPMLRIQLPSGRYLHYLDSSLQEVKMPWKRINQETGESEDVYREAFIYYGMDQETNQWTSIVSHGGKIFENIVQAIARDVLADKLLEFEKIGLEVCGHVHDEGIALSDDDPFAPGVLEMEAIMNKPVEWAPTLPLGSDGFEDSFYHK
jgi:DNA polymerase